MLSQDNQKALLENFRLLTRKVEEAIKISLQRKRWSLLLTPINTLNHHAPDRFTSSRAHCAEKCGSALTHR